MTYEEIRAEYSTQTNQRSKLIKAKQRRQAFLKTTLDYLEEERGQITAFGSTASRWHELSEKIKGYQAEAAQVDNELAALYMGGADNLDRVINQITK